MKQYVDLVNRILNEGEPRKDRTGVGTRAIFGAELKFDLRERFPLVTVKKTLYRSAFVEMLWFLRGEPNTKFLKDHSVPIWDEWADSEGNIGPVYGVQWRRWPGRLHYLKESEVFTADANGRGHFVTPEHRIGVKLGRDENGETTYVYQEEVDQIADLIKGMKSNPTGRRHIVTAWNPGYISLMGLPPCHRDFQCYVSNDGYLDLKWAQRSVDTMLGLPFNIAQYALLTHLLAQVAGLKTRYLMASLGDTHVYENHFADACRMIAEREPKDCNPQLVIKRPEVTDIDGFVPEDFEIVGYEHHPFIKLPVAV